MSVNKFLQYEDNKRIIKKLSKKNYLQKLQRYISPLSSSQTSLVMVDEDWSSSKNDVSNITSSQAGEPKLYHGATNDIKVPSRGSFAEKNASSSSVGLVVGGVEVLQDTDEEYDGDGDDDGDGDGYDGTGDDGVVVAVVEAAAAAAIFWMDLGDMMVVEQS